MKKILKDYTYTKADLRTIALYYEKEYYETIGIEGGLGMASGNVLTHQMIQMRIA